MGMICKKCGEEIKDFEGRYTIEDDDDGKYGMHYSCYEKTRSDFDKSVKRVKILADDIQNKLDSLRRNM